MIHMIRLKKIIILFFRIKFSFYLARSRGSHIRMRCPCDDRRLACRILHRLVHYAFASVHFFTIARSLFVFLRALFNHPSFSIFLVPRSRGLKSCFKSNVIQRWEFAKLIKFDSRL